MQQLQGLPVRGGRYREIEVQQMQELQGLLVRGAGTEGDDVGAAVSNGHSEWHSLKHSSIHQPQASALTTSRYGKHTTSVCHRKKQEKSLGMTCMHQHAPAAGILYKAPQHQQESLTISQAGE